MAGRAGERFGLVTENGWIQYQAYDIAESYWSYFSGSLYFLFHVCIQRLIQYILTIKAIK